MKTVHITDIISEYNPGEGRHFFDKDTMQFFRCRLPKFGIRASDGSVYFVTSERHPFSPRKYTVRRLSINRIETVGGPDNYNRFCDRQSAMSAAKRVVNGGVL